MYDTGSFAFLTFLRYSVSASMAGVSGCSLMRWPSQLGRRLCMVVLHSSVFVLVYISISRLRHMH